MSTNPPEDVTALLNRVCGGDPDAAARLFRWLYQELRGLAHRQMAGRGVDLTQPATAIVHEAYMRLLGDVSQNRDREGAAPRAVGGGRQVQWANRRQFFAAAAQVMRQIRIDDARRRMRLKRGGGQSPSPMIDEPAVFDQDPVEVLSVHEALERLEAVDPRKAELVRLRYFAGLTEQETAEVMELSRRTVQLEWQIARAWLHRELSKGDTGAT